jgi:hypothetical protein
VSTIAASASAGYADAHPGAVATGGAALTHGFAVAFVALGGLSLAGALIAAVFVRPQAVAAPAPAIEESLTPVQEAA